MERGAGEQLIGWGAERDLKARGAGTQGSWRGAVGEDIVFVRYFWGYFGHQFRVLGKRCGGH